MLQTGSSPEAPGPLTSGGWSEDAQRQGCQRQAPPSEAGTRRLVARASKRGGKGTAKPLWVGRAGTEASRACPPPSEGASRGQAVGPWRQRGQSEQAAMRVRMWAGSQARSGCASQETGRTGPGVAPCCRGQDAGVGVEPRRGGGSAGSQRRRRGCSPAPSRPSPVPPSGLCPPQLVYPSDFQLTDKEVGASPLGSRPCLESRPSRGFCVSEKQHLLPVLSRLPLR